jgi:hypothetical protein
MRLTILDLAEAGVIWIVRDHLWMDSAVRDLLDRGERREMNLWREDDWIFVSLYMS